MAEKPLTKTETLLNSPGEEEEEEEPV